MDLRTSVDPAIAQDLFDSARNAAAKGQAQFSTPPEAARALCSLLPAVRPVIADLNCGPGQLLTAAVHGHPRAEDIQLFGCDIQKPVISKQSAVNSDPARGGHLPTAHCPLPTGSFVQADVTKLFPLLRTVDWRCPVFTLNPPWDLHWHRAALDCLRESALPAVRAAFAAHDGRTARDTIDSTVATLMMALDRLTEDGEGLLIANHATMLRLLGEQGEGPHGALLPHVWLWLVFDGNLMTGDTHGGFDHRATPFQTAGLYFARGHAGGPGGLTPLRLADLAPARCASLRGRRTGRTPSTYGWYDHPDAGKLWDAAATEWQARKRQRPAWNLWLEREHIATHLNLYDEKARRLDKATIARLHALNGKRPMDLVLMRAQRDELLWAAGADSPFKVAPELAAAVQQAITDYHAARAPLYPLPKIQRLGYLDEEDTIRCVKNFSLPPSAFSPFVAGAAYPLKSETVTVTWRENKPNLCGEDEEMELTGQELVLSVQDEHEQWHAFADARHLGSLTAADAVKATAIHPLQMLVDHFEIPDVPDVATVRPAEYQRHLRTLQELEQFCP